MLPQRVDEMLRSYRECDGRCMAIERELEELDRRILLLRRMALSDAAAPSHGQGLPHGSGVSNPVERICIAFADGYTPDYILTLEQERRLLDQEYRERSAVVVFVRAWLKLLSKQERFVIENHMIDGVSWKNLVMIYSRAFGGEPSKRTLQRIKAHALMKIYQCAE